MLVVVGLACFLQVVFSSRRQDDTFRVRLVFADCRLKRFDILVSVGRIRRHCFHRNVDKLTGFIGRSNLVAGGSHQALHRILGDVRWTSRNDFIQHGSDQIDIAGRSDLFDGAGCHFRGHVGWRPPHRIRFSNAARFAERFRGLCKSPVHHQDFPELTQHDVFRLQVAVHNPACVSKPDGVSNTHQNVEILDHRLLLNHLEPGCPLDFLHGIEECTLRVGTDIVNRNNVRVIEVACHHCFGKEFSSLLFISSRGRLQHLDGDITIDRSLTGIVDDPHPPFAEHLDQFIFRFVTIDGNRTCLQFRKCFCLDDKRLLGRFDVTGLFGLHRHLGLNVVDGFRIAPDRFDCLQQRFGDFLGYEGLVSIASIERIHRKLFAHHRPSGSFGIVRLDKIFGNECLVGVTFGVVRHSERL